MATVEPDRPHLAAGICGLCHVRGQVAKLGKDDKEAIRLVAAGSTLAAVRLIRERLGWGIHDAVDAVRVLAGKV
ncbi:MAG TPA: hypothetical protein VH092_04950 [Urbifossiella sp.]|nr:hypothetical protein [Urbifossiella sp.]